MGKNRPAKGDALLAGAGHDDGLFAAAAGVDGHEAGEVANLLAVATSTTRKRAWTAGSREAHHLIDPRTGAPSRGDLAYANVAAPTILEADLIAKLLIIEGKPAFERFGAEGFRAVVTDRQGRTEVLGA